MAPAPRVVPDTSVLVAGLRSRKGASFRLLTEVGRGKFERLAASGRGAILFLWRPLLPDPKDDLVLELAVAAGCRT